MLNLTTLLNDDAVSCLRSLLSV